MHVTLSWVYQQVLLFYYYYYYFINAHCIAFEKIHKINYKRTKNIQINQSNQNKKQNSKPIKAKEQAK